MEYLNISTALFSTQEFADAEPESKGTWISLLGWCVSQENGGVILNCRGWGERLWMKTCGVSRDEVDRECRLFHWEGDDLHVWGYPYEVQETLNKRRDAARKNGSLGGRPSGKAKDKTEDEPVPVSDKTNAGTNKKPVSVSSITNTGTNGKPKSVSDETNAGTHVDESETNVESVRKKGRKEESNILSPSFPGEVDEVVSHLRNEVQRGRLVCPIDRLAHFSGLFLSDFRGRGWCFKDGMPVKDWKEAARSFAARCGDNERGFSGGGTSRGQGNSNNSNANRSEYDV